MQPILPRTAEFAALPVTVTIDDVLSSDYDKRETEEDEWERLYLTLPDSDDDELPLHNNADLQNTEGFNRHFWSKAVKREKHNNSSGNLTVVWRFVLKARSGHKLSNLLQGTPPALRLALSYHHWEGEQYGEALLDHLHSFPRLDGVPDEAPQQVQLTPRHHRLHINLERARGCGLQQCTGQVYTRRRASNHCRQERQSNCYDCRRDGLSHRG